jgi:hypothetical protein
MSEDFAPPQAPTDQQPPTPPTPKKKTWLWVTCGVLAVLLACCVGGAMLGGFGLFAAAKSAGFNEIAPSDPDYAKMSKLSEQLFPLLMVEKVYRLSVGSTTAKTYVVLFTQPGVPASRYQTILQGDPSSSDSSSQMKETTVDGVRWRYFADPLFGNKDMIEPSRYKRLVALVGKFVAEHPGKVIIASVARPPVGDAVIGFRYIDKPIAGGILDITRNVGSATSAWYQLKNGVWDAIPDPTK